MINLYLITQHIIPSYTHKMANVSWPQILWRQFTLNRVGQKSKLLILSEYVNKIEKTRGMWTNTNSYRENGALSDIFT